MLICFNPLPRHNLRGPGAHTYAMNSNLLCTTRVGKRARPPQWSRGSPNRSVSAEVSVESNHRISWENHNIAPAALSLETDVYIGYIAVDRSPWRRIVHLRLQRENGLSFRIEITVDQFFASKPVLCEEQLEACRTLGFELATPRRYRRFSTAMATPRPRTTLSTRAAAALAVPRRMTRRP
jgi:hypothetical protein